MKKTKLWTVLMLLLTLTFSANAAPYVLTANDVRMYGGEISNYRNYTEKDIEIPEHIGGVTVTSIGSWAFYNSDLNSVIIPNSVTSIGERAFQENNLSSVNIPSSVVTIGRYAFLDSNISSVNLGNGITSIEANAFTLNNIRKLSIPNSVTHLGRQAFSRNKIYSLTIGSGLETIGEQAFYSNDLQSITIPNTVITINSGAFFENRLTSIKFGSSVTKIGSYAFFNNYIRSVNLPNSVSYIGQGAFINNSALTEIPLPTNVLGYENEHWEDWSDRKVTSIKSFQSDYKVVGDKLLLQGQGTSTNPFLIKSLDDLKTLSEDTRFWDDGYHFELTANINASETANWNSGEGFNPIGNNSTKFTGTFNGGGHMISNLSIDQYGYSYKGLFGYTEDATIHSINLFNAEVIGFSCVGGIVGCALRTELYKLFVSGKFSVYKVRAAGIAGSINGGSIHHCMVQNADISGEYAIGGIVGYAINSQVDDNHTFATLSGDSKTGTIIGESGTNVSCRRNYILTPNHDLLGDRTVNSLTNYYDSDMANATGAIAVSTENAGSEASFPELSFDSDNWIIFTLETIDPSPRPYLSWIVTMIRRSTYNITIPPSHVFTNGSVDGPTTQIIYAGGTSTPLEAIPDAGYVFKEWIQPFSNNTYSSNPLVIKNVTQSLFIVPIFTPAPTLKNKTSEGMDEMEFSESLAPGKQQESNIKVYPNPFTSGTLNIEAPKDAKVEIYSLNGNKVYSATATQKIMHSDLQQGTYVIKIISKDTIQSTCLVVK